MSHPRSRSLFVPWSIDPEAGMKFIEQQLRGREVLEFIRDEQWLEIVHIPDAVQSLIL
jgi:hypothetical protein